MPGGDGTGPMGQGPMTGRAAGYCAGYPVPGYMNFAPGGGLRGRGGGWFRRGTGRGWRNRYYATGMTGYQPAAAGVPVPEAYPAWNRPTPEQQAEDLKAEAGYLEQALAQVKQRLEELDKESDAK